MTTATTNTSDTNLHVVKPIIVSHDYKNTHKHTTMSNIGNNDSPLETTSGHRFTKSSSSTSFKRVSFGSSKASVVQTYTYERIPTTVEENTIENRPSSASHETLDHECESPSKVKVTSVQSEAPHSIHPPSALLGVSGLDGMDMTDDQVHMMSPPLPSLRKTEVENPFRPDGLLSHEVDPIVETYKHRPFPSGHRESIDDPSQQPKTPVSSPVRSPEPPKNGIDHRIDIPLLSSPTLEQQQKRNSTQLDVHHKHLLSAKPGHLEIVHIEGKKRKCACCTVQ